MAFRGCIPDFALANQLYIGCSVAFYTVNSAGQSTGTLAALFADPTSATQVPNPQVLDSTGKFQAPVYIQGPVIGMVLGGSIPSHLTGIINPRGTWRGNWATGTQYYSEDFVFDPVGYIIYVATQDYVSGASIAADVAAGNLITAFSAGAIAGAVAQTASDVSVCNADAATCTAAANAALSAGAIYATTTAGLAATTSGKYFLVPVPGVATVLYLNSSGSAVSQFSWPAASIMAQAMQFYATDKVTDGAVALDSALRMGAFFKNGLFEAPGGTGPRTLANLAVQLSTMANPLGFAGAARDGERLGNLAATGTFAVPKISAAETALSSSSGTFWQPGLAIRRETAYCVASLLNNSTGHYTLLLNSKSIFATTWGTQSTLIDRTGESTPVDVVAVALLTDRDENRMHLITNDRFGGRSYLVHRYSDDGFATMSSPHIIGGGGGTGAPNLPGNQLFSGGSLKQLPNGWLCLSAYDSSQTNCWLFVCKDPQGRGWVAKSAIATAAGDGVVATNECALEYFPERHELGAAVRTDNETNSTAAPLFKVTSADDLMTWTTRPAATWNGRGRPDLVGLGGNVAYYTDRKDGALGTMLGWLSLDLMTKWGPPFTIDMQSGEPNGQSASAKLGNRKVLTVYMLNTNNTTGAVMARNAHFDPQLDYAFVPSLSATSGALGTLGPCRVRRSGNPVTIIVNTPITMSGAGTTTITFAMPETSSDLNAPLPSVVGEIQDATAAHTGVVFLANSGALAYKSETTNFTATATLTGTTSGATATISAVSASGNSGTLTLTNLSGVFIPGEAITDSSGGAAVAGPYVPNVSAKISLANGASQLTLEARCVL
jgi:hypothetical protein